MIAARAQAAGFAFADPRARFAGHGICGRDPWTNQPNIAEPAESFHPDGNGYLPTLNSATGRSNQLAVGYFRRIGAAARVGHFTHRPDQPAGNPTRSCSSASRRREKACATADNDESGKYPPNNTVSR